MHLGTLSPSEDDNKVIDLKQAAFQVTPVDTVTPSLTPTSPPEGDAMAGKKLYSLEKPDDKAKDLASKLNLEEQVCTAVERVILTVHRLCGICHTCGCCGIQLSCLCTRSDVSRLSISASFM